MGAANALAAYKLYAGKIPPTSLNVLAYMALVALDRDSEPSWWEGHEMIAIRCFGAAEPVSKAAHRAVERAITPLFKTGAITTTRHASGRLGRVTTARYRLWLEHPAPDEKRRVHKLSTRRKNDEHPTKNGSAPDEKRRTKEKEEEEERDNDRPVAGTTVEGSPAAAQPASDQDHELSPEERERNRQHDALNVWLARHPEAAVAP